MDSVKEDGMATTIDEIAQALQGVFLITADERARPSGFVQRASKITGPLFAQTLTFGWLANPQATLEELAQTAAGLGTPVTPQAVDQRFTPQAADFLHDLLQDAVRRVVVSEPAAVPILQRFPGGVEVLDGTTVTLPDALEEVWQGCGSGQDHGGRAAVKLQVRLNLLDGHLTGPYPEPGRASDQRSVLQTAPLPPGTLRLADLGYFCLAHLADLSRQGVYWLSRLEHGTKVFDAAGTKWKLADFLRQQPPGPVDVPVEVGVAERLPCRLVAKQVPPEVAAQRRERLRKKAIKKGHRLDPDRWALADWTVYILNVPAAQLTLAEAFVLGRCRWQIELLFKLWKSEGQIDESRSAKPWRLLTELYAKLLGMVVQHWLLLVSCWHRPERSLRKASRTVRAHALNLVQVLEFGYLVRATIGIVQRCLRTGCRINRRRRDPPTHQLLADLPETGEDGQTS
jgi:hypothetical protein